MSERYYQEREGFSNRSLLANANADKMQDVAEKQALLEYQNIERQLTQKQIDLHNAIANFRKKQINNQIEKLYKQLGQLQQNPILARVLKREKELMYKRAEQEGKEALERYRQRAAVQQEALLEQYRQRRKEHIEKRRKEAEKERHKVEDSQKVLGKEPDILEKESASCNIISSNTQISQSEKNLSWKRIVAVCSMILCIVLYIFFLTTVFSEKVDTYICYTTDTGECYHASYCQYLSQSRHKTTVYKATRSYRSCSRCNPCIEKYETTIVVRNYFLPALISVPTSVMVYLLLTKKNGLECVEKIHKKIFKKR